MIVKYECDSCGEDNNARYLISNCNGCGDEICNYCQEQGKDKKYYCEDCIGEANDNYDAEIHEENLVRDYMKSEDDDNE